MSCLPLDFICSASESLAAAVWVLWIFIQIMAFSFGSYISYKLSRLAYSGKFWEINALIAIWVGYFAYKMTALLAVAGAIAAVVVLILAIFTPLGGGIIAWLVSKTGNKSHERHK